MDKTDKSNRTKDLCTIKLKQILIAVVLIHTTSGCNRSPSDNITFKQSENVPAAISSPCTDSDSDQSASKIKLVSDSEVPVSSNVSVRQSLAMKASTHVPLDDRLRNYALLVERIHMHGRDAANAVFLQDDNLLTGAECLPDTSGVCTVEITLPKAASVTGIRLFPGYGDSRKSFFASGRVKNIRIRVDEAEGETVLQDHLDFASIQFDLPQKTRSIRLDILSVYKGKKDKTIYIPELDILGETGVPRASIDIDWQRLFAKADGVFWKDSNFQDSWIEQIDTQGNRQRLFRGAIVHGRAKRRFLIAERFVNNTCPGAMHLFESRYTFVDTHNRMFYSASIPFVMKQIAPAESGEGFFIKGYTKNFDNEKAKVLSFQDNRLKLQDIDHDIQDKGFRQRIKNLGFDNDVVSWMSVPSEIYGEARPCRVIQQPSDIAKKINVALRGKQTVSEHMKWEKCTVSEELTIYLANDMCDETNFPVMAAELKTKELKVVPFSQYGIVDLRKFKDGTVRISAERKAGESGDIYNVQNDGTLKLFIEDALFAPGTVPGCRCSA